jgi:eukaryotic-like serine/threonine-protein kinase
MVTSGSVEATAHRPSPCPSEDELLAFLDGRLDAAGVAAVDAHLDGCAACEQLIATGAADATAATSLDVARQPLSELARGAEVGRYRIVERIGAGGMGVVYAAHDPEMDRVVALKWMRPTSGSDESQSRLAREARALAKLSHPNVVTIFDVGRSGDELYLAMERVTGRTLDDWLGEVRPWRQIVDVLLQAGRGVAAAHRAGLVHRDLKPSNVIVGEDGRVRVIDFGLALEPRRAVLAHTEERATADLTKSGAVLGTPRYMAPEQHRGEPVDARSDQFSFAVMAFEALFGRPPFAGDSYLALRRAVLAGDVATPETSDARRVLIAPLMRALATDPGARFADLDELLTAITRAARRRSRVPLVAMAGIAVAGVAIWMIARASVPVAVAAPIAFDTPRVTKPVASLPSAAPIAPFAPTAIPHAAPAARASSSPPHSTDDPLADRF